MLDHGTHHHVVGLAGVRMLMVQDESPLPAEGLHRAVWSNPYPRLYPPQYPSRSCMLDPGAYHVVMVVVMVRTLMVHDESPQPEQALH